MSRVPNPNRRLTMTTRLTVVYAAVFLVGLSMISGLMFYGFSTYQNNRVDQRLASQLDVLRDEVIRAQTEAGFDPPLYRRTGRFSLADNDGVFVRLLSPTGETVDGSMNYRDIEPATPSLPARTDGVSVVDTLWYGGPARVLFSPVTSDGTVVGWIELASFKWDWKSEAGRALDRLLLLATFALLLSVLGGHWMARRAMRPVTELSAAIDQIRPSDLGSRLPVDQNVRDELTRLTETFNGLLTRLQDAFEREQRFTSNAAHELLNPLASIKNVGEVALRKDRDATSYEEALKTMLENIQRMSRTVRMLLELARLESVEEIEMEEFDLSELCHELSDRYRPQTEAAGLEWSASIETGVVAMANRDQLELAIGNLIDNAIKFTPSGSVNLSLTTEGPKSASRYKTRALVLRPRRPSGSSSGSIGQTVQTQQEVVLGWRSCIESQFSRAARSKRFRAKLGRGSTSNWMHCRRLP